MATHEGPSVYEAAGGDAGLLRLAHAWHERCLADPVMSHPFSHPGGHPQHLERLAAYWAEALGGPTAFTGGLGDETSVLRMHAGNGEHLDMDRRAVACFDAALTDVGITEDPLRSALHDYFAWSTAGWRGIRTPPTRCRTASRCRTGPGTGRATPPSPPSPPNRPGTERRQRRPWRRRPASPRRSPCRSHRGCRVVVTGRGVVTTWGTARALVTLRD